MLTVLGPIDGIAVVAFHFLKDQLDGAIGRAKPLSAFAKGRGALVVAGAFDVGPDEVGRRLCCCVPFRLGLETLQVTAFWLDAPILKFVFGNLAREDDRL